MLVLQGRALERRVEAALGELGLSLRKVGILGHLRREPGLSYSDLARRSQITVQSTHVVMQGLVQDGLVGTDGGEGRGRAAVVSLTERGHARLSAALAAIARIDAEVFAAGPWVAVGEAMRALGAPVPPGARPQFQAD